MKTTNLNSEEKKQISVKNAEEKIPYGVSGDLSEAKIPTKSENVSKNLANSLMSLIEQVNQNGVTPETVNASCNAAAQIYKILRLNFEMKKEGF